MQDAILGGRDKKRMKWVGCEWLLQVQAWPAWEIILERALEADRNPQFSWWGASCPVRLREPGTTYTVLQELEVLRDTPLFLGRVFEHCFISTQVSQGTSGHHHFEWCNTPAEESKAHLGSLPLSPTFNALCIEIPVRGCNLKRI